MINLMLVVTGNFVFKISTADAMHNDEAIPRHCLEAG